MAAQPIRTTEFVSLRRRRRRKEREEEEEEEGKKRWGRGGGGEEEERGGGEEGRGGEAHPNPAGRIPVTLIFTETEIQ